MPSRSNLTDRFVDEPLVVFLRKVALDDLRGDCHGQIDGLAPNLLDRPLGL
jgi:hypothetical protein